MPIKTFRGKIATGEQDTIVLHTNDGMIGYRIKNFQAINGSPGTQTCELVVKVFTIPQTAVTGTMDFTDQTLIGTLYYRGAGSDVSSSVIIVDNNTFNQDIYVTAIDNSGNAQASNYQLDLEQVKLDLNENTVATLKDIRNVTAPT